jgi:hypothetical protein
MTLLAAGLRPVIHLHSDMSKAISISWNKTVSPVTLRNVIRVSLAVHVQTALSYSADSKQQ